MAKRMSTEVSREQLDGILSWWNPVNVEVGFPDDDARWHAKRVIKHYDTGEETWFVIGHRDSCKSGAIRWTMDPHEHNPRHDKTVYVDASALPPMDTWPDVDDYTFEPFMEQYAVDIVEL